MITAPAYQARILGASDTPVTLRDDAGRIVLDASRAPHVEANVIISAATPDLITSLDPREDRRLVLDIAGRSFDLGIREVTPARADGTVGVRLASDEALLGDFAQLVNDGTPREYETSLRMVVDYVLDKIGASLNPGDEDADVTAYWAITNLLPNPSIEVDAANWAAGTGASALTRTVMSTPNAPAGVAALGFTAAAGDANVVPATQTTDYSVQPGRWYVFSFYITSQVARTARAAIQWWSSNGTVLSAASFSAPIATTPAEFRRVTVIAVAPAGVSHAFPFVNTTGNAAGNKHYVDCAMFYAGDELVEYFDPTMTVPGYDIEWQAAPHASTSTRIPDIDRPPEALVWKAGVSGLAFLAPHVQAAGFRLVSNERREWTLRSADYQEPGEQTYAEGANIITADEQLSREAEEWYTGAVFEYSWTDDSGIEQTRIDAYALPVPNPKIMRREIAAAYPGPGRAEYAVQRAQSRGRTVTATRHADWTEAAEQGFTAMLDGTPVQIGTVTKVEFDIAADTVTATALTIPEAPDAVS